MAEAEFSPPELDHLEDALEELERDGWRDPELDDEPSPRVRERLADYRSLLAISREALPMEDVPPGVLDGVLAEAKQAATAVPVPAPRIGWWARWRRSALIPTLALAGTATLVLWIQSSPSGPATREAPIATQPTPASASSKTDAAAAADAALRPAAKSAPGASPPPPPAAAAPAAAAPAQPREPSAGVRAEAPADGDDTIKANDREPSRGAPPEELKELEPASGRWDLIRQADQMRHAGDCVAAREDYAVALEDDEAGVRARAFAGMGLCDRQVGNDPAADANFERARELDGAIDGFIESQRARKRPRRRSGKKRKSKAKPSPSNADAMAPFD